MHTLQLSSESTLIRYCDVSVFGFNSLAPVWNVIFCIIYLDFELLKKKIIKPNMVVSSSVVNNTSKGPCLIVLSAKIAKIIAINT
jgi:hypothetical protein